MNIKQAFTKFKKGHTKFFLKKIKSSQQSAVGSGSKAFGPLSLLSIKGAANMVLVGTDPDKLFICDNFIKTSPVKKILYLGKKVMRFRTESGGVYRLSKMTSKTA